jgi:hypothetical protein
MNNIPLQKLEEISQQTSNLIEVINSSVKWVDKNKTDNLNLAYDLKALRRKFKKVRNVITGKPVIAFFGASQVGKSYMVNSLLCDASKKLFLIDHRNSNIKVDFIKEINPEGHGNESTSVVTRFSTDQYSDQYPPVKIKLLSVKDLICILCDGYFSDVKYKVQLDYEQNLTAISKHIKQLENLTQNTEQHTLIDDDVYDVKEYLEHQFGHSNKNTLDSFHKLGYWHQVAKLIHKIPSNYWHEVFGILWNNQPHITTFFKALIAELHKLKFAKEIYTEFDAVRRGKGAILDVRTLDGLFSQQNNINITVATKDNQIYAINNSYLCALCAEVIFSIEGQYQNSVKTEITKNIDVLDFPGARSREGDLDERNIKNVNVKEMMLRGKVSYLFNSYSLNYEISTLFACMRTAQTNVTEVPGLIKNWIDHNIGDTAEERANVLDDNIPPPLFIIFTWWNTLLGFSSATDSSNPQERIDKWLQTRFKEEVIGNFNWNINWTKQGGSVKRFRNYYLLRDFIKSYEMNKIFDRQYTNEERTDYEEIRSTDPGQNKFLDDFRNAFISSELVHNFFENPTLSFDEASIPNKDGTELILGNIHKIANNKSRTRRYVNQLNRWSKELFEKLRNHYHSDNADEEILKAARSVAEIHAYMNKIFGIDAYNFGSFIETLTISEEDIKILFHEKLTDSSLVQETSPAEWIHFIEYSPRLSDQNSYNENIQVLKEDYYLDPNWDNTETENYFMEKYAVDLKKMLSLWNTQKDKSLVLAEAAAQLWLNSKLSIGQYQEFINLGFDKVALGTLLENIQRSFERLELTDKISQSISYYVNRLKTLYEAENMIAHITAGIINNFVTSLGWDEYSPEDIKKLEEMNEQSNLRMNIPKQKEVFEALDAHSIEDLFEFMSNLNENLRKVPLQEDVIHKIPMIRNYKNWRDMIKVSFVANCNIPHYDVEANQQLGQLLNNINQAKFSLEA